METFKSEEKRKYSVGFKENSTVGTKGKNIFIKGTFQLCEKNKLVRRLEHEVC
jgi:hypothetical protein